MLRYGMIGTGMMGSEHILSLRNIDNVEITAVVDPSEISLSLAKAMLGDKSERVQYFKTTKELVDSNLCDVVVVVTPNMTHEDVMEELLGRDIHILVEKPLSVSVESCRRILDRAKAHKKILWVGLEYRYMPAINQGLKIINSEDFGSTKMISITEHRYPFLPKVNDWNRFEKNTGGTLVEKCCHFFDLMALISKSEPTKVYATGAQDVNHLDESYNGLVPDILDNAYVLVDFENGVRACLDLCMFAEGSKDEQQISVVSDKSKIEIKIPSNLIFLGDRKTGQKGVKTLEAEPDTRIKYQGFHHGSTFLEHLDLIEAIETGSYAKVDLLSGIRSVAIGAAAELSVKTGKAVGIDKDYNLSIL